MIFIKKHKDLIISVFRNKIFHFVGSRYITYLIQFINSLFIAVYLGPYYLGVWGFITLMMQYINQMNFGIAHSVNAIISINKDRNWYIEKIIGTSLTMLLCLCSIVILFFLVQELFGLNIGDKYGFSSYAPFVVIIGVLGYYNGLFSNIYRVYGRLYEIAFNQSIIPILILFAVVFFRNNNLLLALILANLFAVLLSFFLFIIRTPIRLKPVFIWRLIMKIQYKGWHLFIYATSFYLIIISTRSFISGYYTVEQFGYFTFAFALANAVQLLLQSFSYLIFPKFINRLASATNEKIVLLIINVREIYITTSHFLIHCAILLIPVFLIFFPQYKLSEKAFMLIALTVVLYTNSFGYTGLLIAKNQDKKLGWLSLLALVFNILFVIFLIMTFHPPFEYVILATLLSYIIFVYSVSVIGRKLLDLNSTFLSVLKDVFPIKLVAPYLISLILILFSISNIYFFIPFFLFIILNIKALKEIIQFSIKTIENPDIIDI